VADVCEVSPKIGAHSGVWASIDTGSCSGGISMMKGESYGVLVDVADCFKSHKPPEWPEASMT